MAIYFFDFCQGNSVSQDDLGVSFESVEKAYIEVYETALAMWGELLRQRQDPRRCSFRIRDAQGAVLFILPFTELLENCRDTDCHPRPLNVIWRDIAMRAAKTQRLKADLGRELRATRTALEEAKRLIS